MKTTSDTRSELSPLALRIYRFGLATGGLAWICIASTLCGCSSANGWVKNQSGRGYYHRGNYAAARSEFERALMDDPYNPTYAYNVGKAMEKAGDSAGAERMYQHALTLDPSHQPAYRGMTAMLASQGRQDEAVELLTAWAQTQPYSAASHVELANLYRQTGNYPAAEQELNTALKIRPRYRQALNEQTRLAQATGRPIRKKPPFSELALASQAAPPAMVPSPGMMAATPQTSAALTMASTMPQRDPTMAPGVIQASYGHPQMSSAPGPMMATAPQMHQVNRFPVQNGQQSAWMPVPQDVSAGQPTTMMAMPVQMSPGMRQGGQIPVTTGTPLPMGTLPTGTSSSVPPMSLPPMGMSPMQTQVPTMSPQPVPTGAPMHQPIELGQPVPITQAYPGASLSEPMPAMESAPLFSAEAGNIPVASSAPTVQAF